MDPSDVMSVLSAGLKEVGFNFVFDTCWAADLTIMEEGTEFLSRIAEGGTPSPDHVMLSRLGKLL